MTDTTSNRPQLAFPSNPNMPNVFGVSRNQAKDDLLPLLRDLARFANNIGAEFVGPSSNPIEQRLMARVRAQFELGRIDANRIAAVIAALEHP